MQERKLVTVLFADIVGSTALGRSHDAEVVRETLTRTFAAVSEVLRAHGGTVEKFIGDAVMAVFGVPLAHEDDADRAVRAAFALRERVAALHAEGGLALEVRIGLNTGEVVAGAGEGAQLLVTGGPVNAAARIQQSARPGEILVGAVTRQLTRGGVRYGEARDIDAKGIGEVQASPALELATPVPEQQRGFAQLRARLIGRDRELRVLEEAFERSAAEHAPSLVTVFGAAGAGKSRLTSEFVARIGRERVRAGRCLPYGEAITFYPLQLILRADAGIAIADSRAEALSKLRAAVSAGFPEGSEAVFGRVAAVSGLLAPAEALPDVAAADLAEELRWGVRRYFERRATSPLVLVFEDIHWAEPALLDFIEHLAEWSRAPLLLLCLARPEFREARPGWGASAVNAATITLSPLGPEDTRRLISELLDLDALSESLRQEVVSRSEGNPLYVEEFLRTLIETGTIGRRGDRWVGLADTGNLEVPPTLQSLITARLDRASPGTKRLLHRASLVGRLFSTSGLAAIGGEEPRAEHLREAVRRELLVEADESALGEGRVYRFRHVLIRDVAYGTIPKGERAVMHDSYARWLTRALGDRRDEVADIIAFHAEQAFLYAHELGRENAPALGQVALDWLLSAATRARHRADDLAALNLYERAATVTERFDAPLRQRAEAVGFTARYRVTSTSRTEDPRAVLDRAIDIARSAGPSEVLVALLTLRAGRAANDGQHDVAKRLYEQLVEVAREVGEPELLAEAMMERQRGAYVLGDSERERELLVETFAFVNTTGVRRARHGLLIALCDLASRQGDFQAAQEYLRDADAVLPKDRSKRQEAIQAWEWAIFQERIGDYEAARATGEAAVAAARGTGALSLVAWTSFHLAEMLFRLGELVPARAALVEALGIFEQQRMRLALPEVHARLARLDVRCGDLESARGHVEAAKRERLPTDLEAYQIARLAAAEVAASSGDMDRADEIFRSTIETLASSDFHDKLAAMRAAYGEFLLQQGRLSEARAALRLVREFLGDPVAYRNRERIDALLARCEAAV